MLKLKPPLEWRMSRSVWMLMALAIVGLFVSRPADSQLQQSGGPGSTVVVSSITAALPAGANVIGHVIDDSGSTTAVTGNVTVVQGTGTNLHVDVDTALPVGTNVIGHVINDAGAASIGTVRTEPLTSCGTTIVDSGATTVPSGTTAITGMSATATCMDKIYLNNTLGSAATCNVTDVTGPTSYVTSFSIPANSNMLLLFGGVKFAGGAKWFCPTGTVVGQALGYQ